MTHAERSRPIWKAWSLLWLALFLSAGELAQGQSSAVSEDAIRAALVQHLTLFVEWPAWKMDASHVQFNVCLIGSDPIGPALSEAFRGKPVLQKAVVVIHLQAADKVQDCHLLYVGANARREIQHSLAGLEQRPC